MAILVPKLPLIRQGSSPKRSIVLWDSDGASVLDSNGECIYDTLSDLHRQNCSIAVPPAATCQAAPVSTKINRTVAPRLCPTDPTIIQVSGCLPLNTTDGDLLYILD